MSDGQPPPTGEELPPEPRHLRGLRMTYAERLRWLEEAKAAFGRLLGRARVPPGGQGSGAGGPQAG